MQILVMAGLAVLILVLSLILRSQNRADKENRRKKKTGAGPENSGSKKQLSLQSCLLCRADLKDGRTMRTSLYPADGREGRLMEIHGCPHCTPGNGFFDSLRAKKCPLCGSVLKSQESLVARRFEKPGKNQVTVMGCPRCYQPR